MIKYVFKLYVLQHINLVIVQSVGKILKKNRLVCSRLKLILVYFLKIQQSCGIILLFPGLVSTCSNTVILLKSCLINTFGWYAV